MTFLQNIGKLDRATFEGQKVTNVRPLFDKHSKEITHHQLSVETEDGVVELRKFRPDEIKHLIDTEALVVDRGYYSPVRQQDRALYGTRELFGATAAQREKVDLIMLGNRMMERYHARGMKLTRDGLKAVRAEMSAEYEDYQARKHYGTKRANSTQKIKRLPSADTLLVAYRKFRRTNGNPNAFLAPRAVPVDADLQASADFVLVMELLGSYSSATKPSKKQVINDAIDALEEVNAHRVRTGHPVLIRIYSQRTYERWIDKYLDPFATHMQRYGLASAIKRFGTVEDGRKASFPGEIVVFDAWQMHLVVYDTTREEWNRMTEEERAKVKKIRPWATVAEDMATRRVMGLSFSKTPCEQASLEALRMCYVDKTYLLRDIGIKTAKWDAFCPILEIPNDNGSEFGKEPFGGSGFSMAALLLGSTHMNTPAGVSSLRGAMERFFWTSDQKFARYLPGYTAQNPQARNDRKFLAETCIMWDEMQALYLAFIAEYENDSHRGLNFRTPAAVWAELIQLDEVDMTQMPSPGQLREACGFYAKAKISEAGIRYAGAVYSNEFIRNQRKARVVDRIAQPGEWVEIKVDPFDLGGISVLAHGELISVRCLDHEMAGKSLRQWQAEKQMMKLKAQADALKSEGARKEAAANWRNRAESIMRHSDIGIHGYTQAEIDRAALELTFGKGQNEKGFIGRDEYTDPVTEGGFETGTDIVDDFDDEQSEDLGADHKTSMDRLRASAKTRKKKTRTENDY